MLRFFAFGNNRKEYVHDIYSFLDEYIESIAGLREPNVEFNYPQNRERFTKTFALLSRSCGPETFRAWNTGHTSYTGLFRSLLFEALSIGISPYLDTLDPNNEEDIKFLRKAIEDAKKDETFIKMVTGGGKNFPKKLEERIDFVSDFIRKELEKTSVIQV